ncbi:UNVERIFIED_CONTAM: hypothetical protein Scaly_2915900 [Sesamum calycinum]|uniref:Mitochondrial import inner membrane translocase subunit TIM50 n=1 Tax=Sesamum calycinum TaxID=2727403 RepID=A0AAW2KXC8_9LAMI
MDIELLQNPAGGSSKSNPRRRKKRRAKKAAMEKNGPQIMDQMDDLSVQPLAECPTTAAGSAEILSMVSTEIKKKKRRKKVKKKGKIEDEVQSLDETKMDTGLTENPVEGNANDKRKRRGKRTKKTAKRKDEIQSMGQEDSMLNLHLSDGSHGGVVDDKIMNNEGTAQESEISVRKESSSSDLMQDKGNLLDLCKDEQTVSLPDVVEASSNKVTSELVDESSAPMLRPMEVEEELFPRESQLSSHANQMAGEVGKFDNGNNEVEIVVYQGKCSDESRSVISTCDVGALHLSSPDVLEAECFSQDLRLYPRIAPIASIKRKLLVLDVNGLLAHIVMPAPKDCRGDDMFHSTQTGFKTLENSHKPLVFKELRKIWETDDPTLPWKKGDYNESNTLLLDDSPYKALLNPLHTAIFPNSYHYEDKNDNSLGPGGDLRVYLEGLLTSEDVRKYVEQHPFGQSAINETNLSWGFYSGVLQTMSNQLENNTPSSLPTLS